MKPSRSRGADALFLLAAMVAQGACASRDAAAPESPAVASQAYGGADAPAPAPAAPAEKSAEPAPPKQEPKRVVTDDLRATEQRDPAQALADAEKLLDQTLGGKKTGGVQGDSGPKKEEPAADSCSIACRALASMRRSAERLCELAPSASPDAPRCDDAKDRVTKAERRVHDRCPSCAASP